jgi:hypothetical protein
VDTFSFHCVWWVVALRPPIDIYLPTGTAPGMSDIRPFSSAGVVQRRVDGRVEYEAFDVSCLDVHVNYVVTVTATSHPRIGERESVSAASSSGQADGRPPVFLASPEGYDVSWPRTARYASTVLSSWSVKDDGVGVSVSGLWVDTLPRRVSDINSAMMTVAQSFPVDLTLHQWQSRGLETNATAFVHVVAFDHADQVEYVVSPGLVVDSEPPVMGDVYDGHKYVSGLSLVCAYCLVEFDYWC